jgi:hypothetical protein
VIELTDIEIFKDLISLDLEIRTFDLHNDYKCDTINLNGINNSLSLLFRHNSIETEKVCLLFKNISIKKLNFFPDRTSDSKTIDLIYRGRFETETGLQEYSNSGQGYFYIQFVTGDEIELLAEKVFVFQI